eukprot:675117_1
MIDILCKAVQVVNLQLLLIHFFITLISPIASIFELPFHILLVRACIVFASMRLQWLHSPESFFAHYPAQSPQCVIRSCCNEHFCCNSFNFCFIFESSLLHASFILPSFVVILSSYL